MLADVGRHILLEHPRKYMAFLRETKRWLVAVRGTRLAR